MEKSRSVIIFDLGATRGLRNKGCRGTLKIRGASACKVSRGRDGYNQATVLQRSLGGVYSGRHWRPNPCGSGYFTYTARASEIKKIFSDFKGIDIVVRFSVA